MTGSRSAFCLLFPQLKPEASRLIPAENSEFSRRLLQQPDCREGRRVLPASPPEPSLAACCRRTMIIFRETHPVRKTRTADVFGVPVSAADYWLCQPRSKVPDTEACRRRSRRPRSLANVHPSSCLSVSAHTHTHAHTDAL